MAVNYNDERFAKVEADKQQALSELEKTYGGMISESDKYYQAQIDASKQWADKQQQLQQEKTDFAIEQVEQQKDQATKDYTREQSGAYVDWQKESNRYGAGAEEIAAAGMANSGYSESSQVSLYNTYQNRVATAREAYSRAILNYDNAIKDARLQNNSVLAEIAYNALQQQLELSLNGFQYKNQLLLDKANKKTEVDQIYHSRYQDVLQQINTENALAEEIRQFNAQQALAQAQLAEEKRQFNASLAEDQRQFNASLASKSSGGSGGSGGGGKIKNSGGSSGSSQPASIKAEQDKPDTASITTYSGAAAYMRQKGATKGDGGLMTESEWKSRKARGSKSAETSYPTYQAYLANFVTWKVANPDK